MSQHISAFEDTRERPAAKGKSFRIDRRQLRNLLLGAAAIGLLTGAGRYGQYYWQTGRFLVSTDDAYLQADNVIISPQVPGYIADVPVQDNQAVHAGQTLARIDDRPYRAAVDSARADVDAQAAAIENLAQRIGEQQLVVAQARATVDADRAMLTFAAQDFSRYTDLAKTGSGTVQAAQQATSNVQQRTANLNRDAAAAAASAKQIDVLQSQLKQARAMLEQKQAALRQAELNLGYTTITAPTDGVVGARSLRVGQYVQAATQLMAVVPLHQVYVTANYKETQLTDVRPGQKVELSVDTFPGATVQGVVNSIAPASGQEFALLPPDNATGNFTKIVQRVPVKITIDPHDPLIGRLRPGMSVEPSIDTKPQG